MMYVCMYAIHPLACSMTSLLPLAIGYASGGSGWVHIYGVGAYFYSHPILLLFFIIFWLSASPGTG